MYPDNPQFFGKNINTKEIIESEPNTSLRVSSLLANLSLTLKAKQYSRKLAIETNIVFGLLKGCGIIWIANSGNL
ncbi:hypothetical protein MTR_2g035960 [Medicago truncatula]|uniref:Uncharacterized protein n=1 Tax=Medicago truncatula TaxID=3880 RepID=G7IG18_MEDTR|nr:hypothetical protein MTR_2g035960 [Medicago truncatula]